MRRRIFAAFLAAVSLLMPCLGAAEPGWTRTTALTGALSYTEGVFADTDRQAEHYFEYTPGGVISPVVTYGQSLTSKHTFPEAAAMVEAGGKRVLGGVNADYYVVSTNIPLGIVIQEGRLVSSDAGHWALGFLADGSAFLGKPALTMRLNMDGEGYRLGGLNKSIKKGDFFLYTPEYGEKTGVSVPARNVVLAPEPGAELTVGSTMTLTVESNYKSPAAVGIPQGRYVLSLTADSDSWRGDGLAALQPGQTITLTIGAEDPRWQDCVSATGSLYKLVTAGAVEPGLDEIDDNRAPRSAVGIRADGSMVFYTVDGRQSGYSDGLTLAETAARLVSLGCVEAGAMDGGGSTTLRAQQAGDDNCTLLNRPSLGKERAVSTFLLFTTDGTAAGPAETLSARSAAAVMLTGSSVPVTAGACDAYGAPVPVDGLSWTASDGYVDGDGLYTAPDYPCDARLDVRAAGLTSQLSLRVIDTPDALSIRNQASGREVTALSLHPGETVDLSASASWKLLDVWAEDRQFTWSCQGNAGVVNEDGLFTASPLGGAGTITAAAGERTLTIGVEVKTAVMCVADFESAQSGGAEGIAWAQETAMDHVRYGYGSLKLDYDLSSGSALYPMDLAWARIARYAVFWVYGDGSGVRLYAVHDGMESLVDQLDYVGWKPLTVETSVYGGMTGLRLEGEGSGTIWLDQLLLTDYETPDLEPPILTLSADGPLLTATVRDRVDGGVDALRLCLTVDGEILPFQYDEVTGVLTAMAEDNGRLRRATLTARDLSGNLSSVSTEIPGEYAAVFPDMEGHWAAAYAGYLGGLGVVNGRDSGDGVIRFDPDSPVTRAELAVMLCRWKGLDAGTYPAAALTDGDRIPDWAAASVNAAVAQGYFHGEPDGEGFAFRPGDTVTRAQAAAILGRTLEAGRLGADLPFTDAESIPSWALSYVSELAFMGVMRGYEDGRFDPSGPLTRAQAAKLLTVCS